MVDVRYDGDVAYVLVHFSASRAMLKKRQTCHLRAAEGKGYRGRPRSRLGGSEIAQKNKAPEPFGSGAKFGGGRSPRALSHHIRWAHSLSRAVCSPTPLFAACEVFDLMAGSLLPLPIGVYRVRPLRPVRPPPARGGTPDVVQTRLQVADLSRRHRCHEDGIGFWPIVCPALRV